MCRVHPSESQVLRGRDVTMFNSVWGEDEMWRAIRLFLLMSRVIFVFSAVTRVPSSGPFHARFSHRNRSCFTAENSHLSIREVAFLLLIGPPGGVLSK